MSVMDDVDDLYYEFNSLLFIDDDFDSELSCFGDFSEKINIVRGINIFNLMYIMWRFFKCKGKWKGELLVGGKFEECLEFLL